jgi:hypothetical protein
MQIMFISIFIRSPLDCALECEEDDDVVLDIWKFLVASGADVSTQQDYNIYPTPYPPLRASRLVGLLAVAASDALPFDHLAAVCALSCEPVVAIMVRSGLLNVCGDRVEMYCGCV